MKRCVCISCFDHYTTRMQVICNHYLKNGYDTKYIYADFDHFSKTKNRNKYRFGVKIKVPEYNKNLSPQRLYSHVVFTNGVIHYIKKFKPEVIYCMIPPNSLVKKLAGYKRENPNVKLILDCYDLWPESFPYQINNKILGIPFKFWGDLRKNYLSSADLVIGVSEQQLNIIRPELKETTAKIIKPVIDTGDIPDYKSDIEKLDFCYLGMVNHITDMDLAVTLLGKIAKGRTVNLHIIGEGQNLSEFTERLQDVSVNVIQHGVVFDMAEKNAIFSMCNWGLNIPREEINSTMSLKAVEYLRAGLPILNNALGDIRYIIEQDGVGINIKKDNVDEAVELVLNSSEKEMQNMHNNVIAVYKERFANQDLDEILKV